MFDEKQRRRLNRFQTARWEPAISRCRRIDLPVIVKVIRDATVWMRQYR